MSMKAPAGIVICSLALGGAHDAMAAPTPDMAETDLIAVERPVADDILINPEEAALVPDTVQMDDGLIWDTGVDYAQTYFGGSGGDAVQGQSGQQQQSGKGRQQGTIEGRDRPRQGTATPPAGKRKN